MAKLTNEQMDWLIDNIRRMNEPVAAPEPRPKSRGEEVADRIVKKSANVVTLDHDDGTFLMAEAWFPLDQLRHWLAAAIDAERKAERERCAKTAGELWGSHSLSGKEVAAAIRCMKD